MYLVTESESGVQVDFVIGKTKVSPLKSQTIPQLELLSAVLLARLIHSVAESIQDDLQLSSLCCYTDSTVALHWIQGTDKCWKTFVQNRVSEIRTLVPLENWAHCSGRENPADLPSRGLTMQELAASNLWLNGPVWLKDRSLHFATPPIPDEYFLEMKSYDEVATHGLITADANPSIDQVIDCTGYNSLSRLLHVTSFVLKFCHSLLRKVHHSSATNNDFLTEAEVLWIQVSQRSLPNRRRFPQWKTQFDLFVAEDK